MEQYDFAIVKGDETIATVPAIRLPGPQAVWPHLVALAQKIGDAGAQIRVTNEDGGIVVLTGIKTLNRISGAFATNAGGA